MKRFITTAVLTIVALVFAGAAIPVIPLPQSVVEHDGVFVFGRNTRIEYPAELSAEASFLSGQFVAAGLANTPSGSGKAKKGSVSLAVDGKISNAESYVLKITPAGICITGSDSAGVFYGIQTLIQLIEAQGTRLDCMEINDSPRYHWRGFMLDEARHFFGQQKVLETLDMMARFKLNKFHWHLSDSEGWRIEIKAYPRLTEIGGTGSWSAPETGEPRFYTQEQIREVIEYAAERHIEVIPEIDMPGHANAANRAYPEYSGGMSEKYGEFTFNPGYEKTYSFLTDILREVTALFPSAYMHIGGDEVAFGIESWNTNPETQALIEREGFETLRQAEKYFIDRMSDTVRGLGKKLIGWEELVELGVETNTTILWWRQNKSEILRKSLTEGYGTVLCPRVPCYLDFIQDADHKWGRIWIEDFSSLSRLYSFPDDLLNSMDLPVGSTENILGMQGNLWTERIPHAKRLDFMMWPRLCALAESAWTDAAGKDFADFEARMEHAYTLFGKLGIYYYDHRNPGRHPEVPGLEKGEAPREKPMDFID